MFVLIACFKLEKPLQLSYAAFFLNDCFPAREHYSSRHVISFLQQVSPELTKRSPKFLHLGWFNEECVETMDIPLFCGQQWIFPSFVLFPTFVAISYYLTWLNNTIAQLNNTIVQIKPARWTSNRLVRDQHDGSRQYMESSLMLPITACLKNVTSDS